MGRILSTRTTKDNKVIFEVELDYEESLELKGRMKNVHVFSEDAAEIKTNVSQRGANEAILSYMKNNKVIYVFILAVFGAMVLLVIERMYRKKYNS